WLRCSLPATDRLLTYTSLRHYLCRQSPTRCLARSPHLLVRLPKQVFPPTPLVVLRHPELPPCDDRPGPPRASLLGPRSPTSTPAVHSDAHSPTGRPWPTSLRSHPSCSSSMPSNRIVEWILL